MWRKMDVKLLAELFPPEDAANLLNLIEQGTVSWTMGMALMKATIKARAAERGIVLVSKKDRKKNRGKR